MKHDEASQKRYSGPTLAAVLALLTSVVGIQLTTETRAAAASADPRVDKMMVVDCLLPGQLRKLGGNATYMTPRRPVKTTAAECEIRGGEYVAFDRADYGTSLKIWLPKAKEGDPEAQTYVGEIFEKGLGTASDYQAAATWYKKAAEQGYSRAQINLGQLYEQGLGVPQDMRQALNWYRRASGLEDDDLQFASSVRVTMQQKEQKIQQLQEKSQRSEEEAAQLRKQLQEARTELERRQQDLDNTRNKLDEIRKQLKEQDDALKSNSEAGLKKREQALDEREADLKAKRDQLEKLESELASKRDSLSEKQRKAAEENNSLQSQLVQQNAETQRLQDRLEQVNQELADSRDKLDQSDTKDAALVARLQAAQSERESLEQQLGERKDQTEQLRNELQAVKKNLDQSAAEYAKAVKDLQERKALQEVELQQVKAERDQLASKSKKDTERIKALRAKLEQQEKQYEDQLETLKQEYAQSREDLKAAENEVAADSGGSGDSSTTVASAPSPSIELIEPPVTLTRSGEYTATIGRHIDTREVMGKVKAPAGVKLFQVNEQPATVDDNGLFNVQVPIREERTPVSMVVVDKAGQRVSLDIELFQHEGSGETIADEESQDEGKGFPRVKGLGKYHALVIGNSNYQYFPDLRTPGNDAKDVAEILKKKYGYETRLLLDANRYEIISALNDYRANLNREDNLLIYYAGHGEIDKVNDNGYWMPVDAEKNNTANWISTRSISEILNVMAAKHVLIVADSCYSGALTRSALARLQTGKTVDEWVEWFKKVSQMRTRMVMSSGGEEPVNDGGGGDHSLFAKAFIDALQNTKHAMDGYRLFLEVSNEVEANIKSQKLGVEQTPEYAPIKYAGHEAGEYIFQPES